MLMSSSIADLLVELLEVAITSIVFIKGFYPSGAFERRRYMNIVVHRAKHPELRDYIHSAATSLRPHIEKGLVERVAVVFYGGDEMPVERFVFKIMINDNCENTTSINGEILFALRAFLIKLSVSTPTTTPLPNDCRWEVVSYFRQLPEIENGCENSEMWIPTETKQWEQPTLITPIKSTASKPFVLQLYLEHPNQCEPKS